MAGRPTTHLRLEEAVAGVDLEVEAGEIYGFLDLAESAPGELRKRVATG